MVEKLEKSVIIRSKTFVAKSDPLFQSDQGWSVLADIRIGGNTWSGLHFVHDDTPEPQAAEEPFTGAMTEDDIKAALLAQYGG